MTHKTIPLHFKFYHSLQYLPLGSSFGTKLFFVAFVAIHVPLITLLLYVIAINGQNISASIPFLVVTLVATLVSTIATLFVFHAALLPLRMAAFELNQYLDERKMPNLPMQYKDDVGDLMGNIQRVVSQLEFNLRRQETLASTDGLTDTLNRRAFFNAGVNILSSKQFRNSKVSLLILDIDRFKLINDTFGHPAGDSVIRAIANLLRESISGEQKVGRLGGEEFAVLLPDTDAETAMIWAETVRQKISKISFPDCIGHAVSASFGVTVLEPQFEVTLDDALERADRALYSSKESGRNKVSLEL